MAVKNHKQTCISCIFFIASDRIGLCNRFPQSVNKHISEWCGEFVLDESSLPITNIVQAIIDPVVVSEEPKKRGRPAKKNG